MLRVSKASGCKLLGSVLNFCVSVNRSVVHCREAALRAIFWQNAWHSTNTEKLLVAIVVLKLSYNSGLLKHVIHICTHKYRGFTKYYIYIYTYIYVYIRCVYAYMYTLRHVICISQSIQS